MWTSKGVLLNSPTPITPRSKPDADQVTITRRKNTSRALDGVKQSAMVKGSMQPQDQVTTITNDHIPWKVYTWVNALGNSLILIIKKSNAKQDQGITIQTNTRSRESSGANQREATSTGTKPLDQVTMSTKQKQVDRRNSVKELRNSLTRTTIRSRDNRGLLITITSIRLRRDYIWERQNEQN